MWICKLFRLWSIILEQRRIINILEAELEMANEYRVTLENHNSHLLDLLERVCDDKTEAWPSDRQPQAD